jgi:hypothetical protein
MAKYVAKYAYSQGTVSPDCIDGPCVWTDSVLSIYGSKGVYIAALLKLERLV